MNQTKTFRKVAALPMTLAVLFLAACGSDSSSTSSDEEGARPNDAGGKQAGEPTAAGGDAVRSAKIEIVDFEYAPPTVTVQAGGKVTWLNQDSAEHTATLDDGSFSTGTLAEGKLKSESFKVPGSFAYHCEIHPDMKGTVEVVEPD